MRCVNSHSYALRICTYAGTQSLCYSDCYEAKFNEQISNTKFYEQLSLQQQLKNAEIPKRNRSGRLQSKTSDFLFSRRQLQKDNPVTGSSKLQTCI